MYATVIYAQWDASPEADTTFKLELQKKDFVGESELVNVRGRFMDHNYQTLNLREPFKNTLLSASLKMPFSMQKDSHVELFEDVFNSDPGDYRIVKTVDDELQWIGQIDRQQMEYPRSPGPIQGDFMARDLDELNAYDYGFQEGRQRIIKVIADILASLDYDLPIRTYTSWKESDMDDTEDFLNERYIDRYVLRIYGRGGEPDESISKYEALERVLKPFKLFIIQSDGYWHLFQISALENADNILEFEYEPDGEQVVES